MGWKPLFSLCSFAAAVAACHESSSEPTGAAASAQHVCDPLAPPSPALADVVVAGRAADGTVYVVDRPEGQLGGLSRVFIGSGGVLERVKTDGAAYEGDVIGLDAAGLRIRVELQNNKGTAIFVSRAEPPEREKVSASGEGESLTLLQDGDVRGLTVHNPLAFTLLADATGTDGKRLFVFQNEVRRSEKHVFYGTSDRLLERQVASEPPPFGEDTTRVTFDLEGVPFHAHLASARNDPSGPTSLARADGTGASVELVPVGGSPGTNYGGLGVVTGAPFEPAKSAAELTSGVTFVCF